MTLNVPFSLVCASDVTKRCSLQMSFHPNFHGVFSFLFVFLMQRIKEHASNFDYFNRIWIRELLLKPFNKLGAHINMLKQ
jgi:hypothetical protein